MNFKKVRRSRNVLTKTNPDGSMTLLHLDQMDFVFTASGGVAEIWKAITEIHDRASLVSWLEDEYGLTQTEAKKELGKFLKEFSTHKLLEIYK